MDSKSLSQQGKEAEEAGDVKKAITLYEKAIRQKPVLEQPYTRLMILYRKLKKPKEELRVIDAALEVFKTHFDESVKQFSGNDAIGRLSKALLKSVTGFTERTREYPQPVPKWLKRREQVKKK